MAKWEPFVGRKLSNVTFKRSWKRYKDFKVALNKLQEYAVCHDLREDDPKLLEVLWGVRAGFFEYYEVLKSQVEELAAIAFPMRMVTSVVDVKDREIYPGRVVVTFTDTNPEFLFWVLDGRTRSTANLLVERVNSTGENSRFWKEFLRPVLLHFRVRFQPTEKGSVFGKTLVVENHECSVDLHRKVGLDDLTLQDLKLCTHCREPGHTSDRSRRRRTLSAP